MIALSLVVHGNGNGGRGASNSIDQNNTSHNLDPYYSVSSSSTVLPSPAATT
jgi:hypothetical protein